MALDQPHVRSGRVPGILALHPELFRYPAVSEARNVSDYLLFSNCQPEPTGSHGHWKQLVNLDTEFTIRIA